MQKGILMGSNTDSGAKKYDALHFFLDESGKFDSPNDTLLVGGVLLFGPYDEGVRRKMRDTMAGAIQDIQGKFPRQLHYNDFHKNPQRRKRFLDSIARRLNFWRRDNGVEAYCGYIFFDHDIYLNSARLLAERDLDNRYTMMLWSLIEHFVFVNDEVARRLVPDAAIHLHVANRAFPFPKDDAMREAAESYGWHVREDRNNPNGYIITSVINPGDLRTAFRMALRDRWKQTRYSLESVEVESINYSEEGKQKPESTPGLYLADIVLGVERQRGMESRVSTPSLLPVLGELEYGHSLEALAQCVASVQQNNLDALLTTLESHPINLDSLEGQQVMEKLVEEFHRSPAAFYRLFESASDMVNHPARREHGIELAGTLEDMYRRTEVTDPLCELYIAQTSFSLANHTGDFAMADESWTRFLELEPSLCGLDVSLFMQMQVEFRCRRAVSLMDRFAFAEAEQIVQQLGEKEDDFRRKIAELMNTAPDELNRYRLGVCFNTMAQVYAFQSAELKKREMAEAYFREALKCFSSPTDLERSWIYLGHLACDFPGDGQALWEEVEAHLPAFEDVELDGLKLPFVWALRLKAALVFGDEQQKKVWFDRSVKMLAACPADVLEMHPYGLIFQTLALLASSQGDMAAAERYFQQAETSLAAGEHVLKFLATVARLRSSVSLALTHLDDEASQARLATDVARCVQQAAAENMACFPMGADIPPLEAADRIIENIRFNYW